MEGRAVARRDGAGLDDLRDGRGSALRLEDARQRIGELEKANRRWRDVAAVKRSRAAAAEDALRRSYRVALEVGGRRV